MIRLKVCLTCDRYSANPGATGAALAAAVARAMPPEAAETLSLLRVECLSGCKHPGQAMVSGNGPAIRFADLKPADAPALIADALSYAAGLPCSNTPHLGAY